MCWPGRGYRGCGGRRVRDRRFVRGWRDREAGAGRRVRVRWRRVRR